MTRNWLDAVILGIAFSGFGVLLIYAFAGRNDIASVLGGLVYCAWVGVGLVSVSILCLRGVRASGWPTTPGVVVSAEVKRAPEAMMFRPEVVYEYSVDGKLFRSDRVQFGPVYWGWQWLVQWGLRNPFRVGDSVTVHYCPTDPQAGA